MGILNGVNGDPERRSWMGERGSWMGILNGFIEDMKYNIKLMKCVIEHGFLSEFLLSTWLIQTLFTFSCFNVHPHTYSYALVHTVFIVVIMVVSGNKVRSWLGFFEILWWHNDRGPSPDELAKRQHLFSCIKVAGSSLLPWVGLMHFTALEKN